MTGFFRPGLAAICLLLSCRPVFAQAEAADPWPKFELAIGGFVTESDTTVQINSETLGVGAVIDLENVLGVERNFRTYRVDALYRFGTTRRNEIEFHYYDSKRDGDKVLDQDLQIGDTIFPAGTGVSTEFKLTFYNVDYVYNFLMNDHVRLGVSAGLHTTGVKLRVEDTGGSNGENQDFTAPLPMLGLRLDVLLTRHWRMKTNLNVFYLEYDDYTGRLNDSLIAVEYVPWKHFGVGAGVNAINYFVENDGDTSLADLNGSIRFQLTGLMVYLKYFF